MAAGEVENVAYQFMMNLGRGMEWDPEEFDAVAAVIPAFKVREHPDMMSASEGGGGSWKSGRTDVVRDFILQINSKCGQGGRGSKNTKICGCH